MAYFLGLNVGLFATTCARKAETHVLVTCSQCKITESRLQKRLGDVNCEVILDTLRHLQSDFKTERSCLLEKSKKNYKLPKAVYSL